MPPFAEPSPTPARNRPLHGLHVLDLSTVISGPMAVAILADQGAAAHVGEHGAAVLAELGFDAAQVARWVAEKAVILG